MTPILLPILHAAIFVLRAKGEAEPLVKVESFIKVPRNGTPVEVSLGTGQSVPAGKGDFRVEAWTQDQGKDARGRYDWRCRVTAPGGGLMERNGAYAFEAPVEGYKPSDVIEMPKTAERWNPQVTRQYFAKLANNTFARVEFEMVAGGDHFFRITSFVNPSGSRNLEYDASKQAPAR